MVPSSNIQRLKCKETLERKNAKRVFGDCFPLSNFNFTVLTRSSFLPCLGPNCGLEMTQGCGSVESSDAVAVYFLQNKDNKDIPRCSEIDHIQMY